MNKRVLSMLTAGAMAASTLLSSVPAFAAAPAGKSYVMMNIPYSEFYAAEGVSTTVDALSSATKNKTMNSTLAWGSYHVKSDGTEITGVTYPVLVDTADLSGYTKVSSQSDLFNNASYAYYVLSEDPTYYKTLTKNADGSATFSKSYGNESNVSLDDVEVSTDDNHCDYAISFDKRYADIYAATITIGGKTYGLHHVAEIWNPDRKGKVTELGFNDEGAFTAAAGQKATGATLYTANGIINVDFTNDPVVPTYVSYSAYTVDSKTIAIKDATGKLANATASVYYQKANPQGGRPTSVYLAKDVQIVDGKIVLTDGEMLDDGTTYYVALKSEYPTKKVSFTYPCTEPVSPSTGEVEEESSSKHTHNYEWVTTKAATATTDGVMKYRCTKCGTVEYEVPISAYYVFNKDTQQAIKNAAAGATVKVETPIFISFHEMVKEALVERADVTLVVDYKNAGKSYEMTIPAGSGATLETLFGQDKFAGFLYLGGAFATVEK